jgi:hypothetical protein
MALLPAESQPGFVGNLSRPIAPTFDEETGELRGHVTWANAF